MIKLHERTASNIVPRPVSDHSSGPALMLMAFKLLTVRLSCSHLLRHPVNRGRMAYGTHVGER